MVRAQRQVTSIHRHRPIPALCWLAAKAPNAGGTAPAVFGWRVFISTAPLPSAVPRGVHVASALVLYTYYLTTKAGLFSYVLTYQYVAPYVNGRTGDRIGNKAGGNKYHFTSLTAFAP